MLHNVYLLLNYLQLQIYNQISDLQEFTQGLGTNLSFDTQELESILHTRLSLPVETVRKIMELPAEYRGSLPLGKDVDTFLRSFISFWKVTDQAIQIAYRQILDSSPTLRVAFERIRSAIIEKGEADYHREFNDPARAKRTEREIKERKQQIMAL